MQETWEIVGEKPQRDNKKSHKEWNGEDLHGLQTKNLKHLG